MVRICVIRKQVPSNVGGVPVRLISDNWQPCRFEAGVSATLQTHRCRRCYFDRCCDRHSRHGFGLNRSMPNWMSANRAHATATGGQSGTADVRVGLDFAIVPNGCFGEPQSGVMHGCECRRGTVLVSTACLLPAHCRPWCVLQRMAAIFDVKVYSRCWPIPSLRPVEPGGR